MKLAPARRPGSRNPQRSQELILAAAFQEFAEQGFAGARVDRIARRAGINKRMLYHYFGDKEALFRQVLRRKIAERKAWGVITPDEASESLPYWFELACKDVGWIRLLEWEALQFVGKPLIDEQRRRKAILDAVARVRRRQKTGHLSEAFTAKQMLLAMISLTWFPLAFPQLTRLISGHSVLDPAFQAAQREFLRRFAVAFKNGKAGTKNESESRANGDVRLNSK